MNEYDSAVIGVVSTVLSSKLLGEDILKELEDATFIELTTILNSVGYHELSRFIARKDHFSVDIFLLERLRDFLDVLLPYLPQKVREALSLAYSCWIAYVLRNAFGKEASCDREEFMNKGKEEFYTSIKLEFSQRISFFPPEDKLCLQMLFDNLFYGSKVLIPEEKRHKGIWELTELLFKKTEEIRTLSKTIHLSLLRAETWKKELFVE